MPIVRIPVERITDWDTFHDVFSEVLFFPPYYGRSMNAWIDCLMKVDDPDAGTTRIVVAAGEVVTLRLDAVDAFARRCPEQYEALVEGVAFVNWRRIAVGARSILALAYHRTR